MLLLRKFKRVAGMYNMKLEVSVDCIKLIHLLFSLTEDRSEPYLNARKCLEKKKFENCLRKKVSEKIDKCLSKWKSEIKDCGKNQDCKRRVVKEAIACLKSLESSDDCCIGYLVEFLRSWNKNRRKYNLELVINIIKKVMDFIKFGNNINSLNPEVFRFEEYEFIGVIKILHVLKPNIYPLLDNPIAESLDLFSQISQNDPPEEKILKKIEAYKRFKFCLDILIKEYFPIYNPIFRGIEIHPYKTIDEFLFLAISKDKKEILDLLSSMKMLSEEGSQCIRNAFLLKCRLENCLKCFTS